MPRYDYYYGEGAEQFQFYRIPRRLILGVEFRSLSTDTKLLYGLMLDRMGLSAKNGWYDNLGRVYIYYTLGEIQKDMNCGHDKAVKLLAELDTGKGIGLIERVKQGQGRPCKIYVKQFTTATVPPSPEKPEDEPSPNSGSLEFGNPEVQTSDFPKSRVPNIRSADFGKTESNYTDRIYTDKNHTDPSIYPSCGPPDRTACRSQLMDQIDYEQLQSVYGEEADAILELLVDTYCSSQKTIRIGGSQMPMGDVRKRLQKLEHSHVEYVLDCMKSTKTKIRNIRGYLLTSLYNAPITMEHYYQAAVHHDLYGST